MDEAKTEKTYYSYGFNANPLPPGYQHLRFYPPPSLEDRPEDFPWFMRPIIRMANKIADMIMSR